MSKGKLIVISGASGVGKGTVLGIMMKKRTDFSFSVSATTRDPRPGEVEGVHYTFITKPQFEEMIARGEFLEYDAHSGNYYGTPRAQAEEKILLAEYALGDRYDRATMLKWLNNFYRRFFTQQFKRSCLPDGPKVGSVTLSPRGDWRMPSDAVAALWMEELESLN